MTFTDKLSLLYQGIQMHCCYSDIQPETVFSMVTERLTATSYSRSILLCNSHFSGLDSAKEKKENKTRMHPASQQILTSMFV